MVRSEVESGLISPGQPGLENWKVPWIHTHTHTHTRPSSGGARPSPGVLIVFSSYLSHLAMRNDAMVPVAGMICAT